jgi:NAD(P)-dependent dehydrogenase (short-subunit alcohol dehydrogenase family)
MDGKDYAGKSAVVTGGASGLGEATAELLASKGVHVVIADLNADAGSALATTIGGTFVKCDVTDTDDVIATVDEALTHGPLQFAVNCAGIGSISRTVGRDGQYSSAFPLDYFRKVVEINLIGTFDMTRIAATAMSRNAPDADGQRGAIVNTTSVAAFDGQIGQVAYSASKGGVVSLTLPLARDLSAVGVRVNTIAPGLIDTPIYGSGPESEAFKAKLGESVVFPKRLGNAAEFASMAWELLSNPYMNGEVIRVDGAIRMPPK